MRQRAAGVQLLALAARTPSTPDRAMNDAKAATECKRTEVRLKAVPE